MAPSFLLGLRRILLRCLAAIGVGCLLLALFNYPWSLTILAKFLTLSQPPERADLVLVLGGDFWGPRVLLGADLGVHGYAPRVLISGPPYVAEPESELAIRFLVEKGYPKDIFISFPNTSTNTIEEALAVCPELSRLGARKVLLVTTAYHSRRANIVYRLFCPNISFRSVSAPDVHFAVENWWKTERFRQIFLSEWEKIAGTIFWKYPEHKFKDLWPTTVRKSARTQETRPGNSQSIVINWSSLITPYSRQ